LSSGGGGGDKELGKNRKSVRKLKGEREHRWRKKGKAPCGGAVGKNLSRFVNHLTEDKK
jgi:hypothetical protein